LICTVVHDRFVKIHLLRVVVAVGAACGHILREHGATHAAELVHAGRRVGPLHALVVLAPLFAGGDGVIVQAFLVQDCFLRVLGLLVQTFRWIRRFFFLNALGCLRGGAAEACGLVLLFLVVLFGDE